MSRENPLWGAPRIHGELLKLGIDVGETSVGKYRVRRRKPPSRTGRTFLENLLKSMVSVDFFTVPTVRFQVLHVFLVVAHDRRRVLHFHVTGHPAAEWTAQRLRDAFRGTPHRAIFCVIVAGSSATTSPNRSRVSASTKCCRRPGRPGSALTSSLQPANSPRAPGLRDRLQ